MQAFQFSALCNIKFVSLYKILYAFDLVPGGKDQPAVFSYTAKIINPTRLDYVRKGIQYFREFLKAF